MNDVIIASLASIGLGSLTGFLVYINWKIFKISEKILEVSYALLKETVVIRVETVKIRDISADVLVESIRLRKAMGDPIECGPELKTKPKKNYPRIYTDKSNQEHIAI